MSKTITFVTSGQPSANPRLLKEALTLYELGFKVNVLYTPISLWADNFDKQIFTKYPGIYWIKCGVSSRENRFIYQLARFRKIIWSVIYKLFGNVKDAALKSLVLYSQELQKHAIKIESHLYIGHNLGSLLAITKASKRFGVSHIFDFEDYHRGEYLLNDIERRKIETIENSYMDNALFASASSPIILKKYQKLFPRLNIILLYNSFPLSYSTKKLSDIPELPIKIFWFSQYLGKNRGLENVIKAISEFAPELFTLTLLGHTSIGLKHYFVDLWENSGLKIQNLTFLDTVEEKNLVKIASCFHIGLASEVPVIENREYCLTNKIFIYLLAGNAILYSKTKAQSLFFESNLSHGQIYECNSIESIKNCLEYYLKSPALLLSHRENSLKLGTQVFNWDLEKQKFINFIHDIIH